MRIELLRFYLILTGLAIVLSGCWFVPKPNKEPVLIQLADPTKIRYLEDVFTSITADSDAVYLVAFNPDSSKNENLEVHHWYPVGDTLANGDTVSAIPVLFQHGGGWKTGRVWNYGNLPERLVPKGYHLFSFDWRLTGQDDGWIYGGGDFRSAISWVKKNADSMHVDTTKMVVCGESAGGYNAWFASMHGSGMAAALDTQATILSGTGYEVQLVVPISSALVLDDDVYHSWIDSVTLDDPPVYVLNSDACTIVLPAWQDTTLDSTKATIEIHRTQVVGDLHAVNDYPGNDAGWPALHIANSVYRHFFGSQRLKFYSHQTDTTDNFNRANEGPPPSSSWTNTGTGLQTTSNLLQNAGAGLRVSFWNTQISSRHRFGAAIRVATGGGDNDYFEVYPNHNGGTTVGGLNGYTIRYTQDISGVDEIEAGEWTSGSRSVLETQEYEFQGNGQIGSMFDNTENRIYMFMTPASSYSIPNEPWVIFTIDDNTHTGDAYGAMGLNDTSPDGDDFQTGEMRMEDAQ